MTRRIGKVVNMKANERRQTGRNMYRHTIQNLNRERSEVCHVPFARVKQVGDDMVHEAKRWINSSGRETISKLPFNRHSA